MQRGAPANTGFRMPALAGGVVLPVLLYACSGPSVVNPDATVLDSLSYREPDKLLIVDCMVPGRVRQLGSQLVILEPRRPQKLAAGLCEIKGGEYVAYDRANLTTARMIWQEKAETGDAEAQTYLGEIYEKGLGTAPDFNRAADWYRKAADQGNARAQLNLATLYEKGLGVPQDKAKALNLYRMAAGLEQDELEFVSTNREAMAAARQRISELQTQVERANQRSISLRQELDETKQELRQRRSRLDDARKEVDNLRARLQASDVDPAAPGGDAPSPPPSGPGPHDDSDQQQERIDALEQEQQALEAQLQKLKQRETQLAGELEVHRTDSRVLRSQVRVTKQQLLQQRRLLEQARSDLARARSNLSTQEPLLQGNAEEIQRLNTAVQDSEAQVATLQAHIVQLGSGFQQQQNKLEAAEARSKRLNSQLDNNNRELVSLGGQLRQAKQREETLVSEIGSLEVKLDSYRLDDALLREELDRKNAKIAKLTAELEGLENKVTRLSGELDTTWIPEVNFGTYHALVIGNSNYGQLEDLPTAKADAGWVEEVLRNHYGFKTRILTDANRAQIILALATLSSELRENDNLLVFYAGHGYLDKAKGHGYWQPVDALPDNPHSWISDDQIAGFLSNLKSRHVLLVADSVYSVNGGSTSTQTPTVPSTVRDRTAFKKWLKAMSRARTRMVLTSGGLQPVTRKNDSGHSVFARAFLAVLQDNDRILPGSQLYYELYQQVTVDAVNTPGNGTPRYVPIRFAGHQAGEFFFKRQLRLSLLDTIPPGAVPNFSAKLLASY